MGRDENRTDLQRLRSRVTVDGLDRAPHRAFLRAMGLDDAAIARPFIGVVSTAGEMTPCNMTLSQQAAAAKIGVTRAGGTPREFTTVSVSDGLSMNHQGMKFSLISRELIADSIEAVVRAHCYVWTPPTRARLGGLLEKYAAVVGPANLGAITHSGNVGWPE